MAVTHGARTDVLLQISASFARETRSLDEFHTQANRAVSRLAQVWRGPDSSRYAARWAAQERALVEAGQRLAEMAEQLRQQASAQDQTSQAAKFGPTVPTGPTTPGTPAGPLPKRPPAGPPSPNAPVPGTIDAQLRGTQGVPEDRALWQMAFRAYGDMGWIYDKLGTQQPPPPPGWTQITNPAELAKIGLTPNDLYDPDTKIDTNVYRNAEGQYVLAFGGSDQFEDWVTDGVQGLTDIVPAQYQQAMDMARRMDAATHGNVVFTGHSLGGGLASAASLATGNTAVTFDAAGVSHATAEYAARLNGDYAGTMEAFSNQESGQIRTYHVQTDILTNAQETGPYAHLAPDALGHHIELPVVAGPGQSLLEGSGRRVGTVIGGAHTVLSTAAGAFTGLVTGGPMGLITGAAEGYQSSANSAQVGAQMGLDIGAGIYGHSWNAVDLAMAQLYP